MLYAVDYEETLAARFTVEAPEGLDRDDLDDWLDAHESKWAEAVETHELAVAGGHLTPVAYLSGASIVYAHASRHGDGGYEIRLLLRWTSLDDARTESTDVRRTIATDGVPDPEAEAELVNLCVREYGLDPEQVDVHREMTELNRHLYI